MAQHVELDALQRCAEQANIPQHGASDNDRASKEVGEAGAVPGLLIHLDNVVKFSLGKQQTIRVAARYPYWYIEAVWRQRGSWDMPEFLGSVAVGEGTFPCSHNERWSLPFVVPSHPERESQERHVWGRSERL